MIKTLFHQPITGHYQKTDKLHVSQSGITGAVEKHPWRQLLLLPTSTLEKFDLEAGQLKENLVVEMPEDLHDLPSGMVLEIGTVQIRLTFHCEPCSQLKSIIKPDKLTHHRGYLAQILTTGEISLGDSVKLIEKQFDAIPYAAADRISWFLAKYPETIFASELVQRVGLPKSYCRALPRIVKRNPSINAELIKYKKNQ